MEVEYDTEQVVAFLLFAVVAAVTPGPSNIMLTAAGANAGVLQRTAVPVRRSRPAWVS